MDLKYVLEQAWNTDLPEDEKRKNVVRLLKERHEEILVNMSLRLNTMQTNGLESMFLHADEFDEILIAMMTFVCEIVFAGEGYTNPTLIAVGGYGRKELAPYSDIDILFLLTHGKDGRQLDIVSFMMYLLWDMGLKIGQSARTVEDCIIQARQDMTVRTNLLEARFVHGNRNAFYDFSEKYNALCEENNGKDFVEAKLLEQTNRYRRMGISKYLLEPNVKEGHGGLRDLHLMFWLSKYLFGITNMPDLVERGILTPSACDKFLRAHRFLSTVRCHLHLINGKAGDVLTFDAQKKIAERMGYIGRTGQQAVERFMKHYYLVSKNVGELTRLMTVIITDTLNEQVSVEPLEGTDDFYLINNRISLKPAIRLEDNPLLILQAFALKQKYDLLLNPWTIQRITDESKLTRRLRSMPEAQELFFEILLSDRPEGVLRLMTESGVLGYFIPEFQKLVAQVQFDLYHIYTTDEHTLKTIGALSDSRIDRPQSKRVLYTAALLHDIGKGKGSDHAERGAIMAEKITVRLGLDAEESETVIWLVRNHLLMSQTAFRRDIFDPKTIEDFVAEVQSPERLRLLHALTVADIKAVGPSVWNSFKEKLLKDLRSFAMEKMQGEDSRPRRLSEDQEKLAALALNKEYAFSVKTDEDRDVTEFIVLAPDHDGLFAEITGAMALIGVSVVEAQIATLDNGMALDTFVIQDVTILNERTPLNSEKKIKRLQDKIIEASKINIEEELFQKRSKAPLNQTMWNAPRVFVGNTASNASTLIEINGTDAVGFLHAVTRAMTLLNLKIVSAHIYTYGSRVVDVFYVTNKSDQKVTDDGEIEKIKTTLLDTINGTASFSH